MSMALILLVRSRAATGGTLMRPLLVVSLAVILQYFADVAFDHRAASGEYYNGDFADLLYWAALVTMLGAFVAFRQSYDKLFAGIDTGAFDEDFAELPTTEVVS
jgi:hypothetical protein